MTYLAFRNLFQQKFRLALSIGGVALAMTLIVLLNGFLAGGQFKDVIEMAVDPVCGMSVDRDSAPAHAEYERQVFYFCARGCRDEFLETPDRFLDVETRQPTAEK